MSDDHRWRCQECGTYLDGPEYHPHAFCVLVNGGYDPWQVIRITLSSPDAKTRIASVSAGGPATHTGDET